MLAFVEDYLRRIRGADSENDIIAILGAFAADVGFRSGYLIEYTDDLAAARWVLDSSPSRAGWWDYYISSGLRARNQPLADVLAKGGVQYFTADRFSDTRDPMLTFSRRVDIANAAVIPISDDSRIAGLVGLCGETRLSEEQEWSVQLVCYSLFSRSRAMQLSGIRTAAQPLTRREIEVMLLSSEGMTSQEMADRLGLSSRTVNQHLDNVADKLGTKNRVHTVAEAIRRDIL